MLLERFTALEFGTAPGRLALAEQSTRVAAAMAAEQFRAYPAQPRPKYCRSRTAAAAKSKSPAMAALAAAEAAPHPRRLALSTACLPKQHRQRRAHHFASALERSSSAQLELAAEPRQHGRSERSPRPAQIHLALSVRRQRAL